MACPVCTAGFCYSCFLEQPDDARCAETGRSKFLSKEIYKVGCDWFLLSDCEMRRTEMCNVELNLFTCHKPKYRLMPLGTEQVKCTVHRYSAVLLRSNYYRIQ
jgi:hypothetical protein